MSYEFKQIIAEALQETAFQQSHEAALSQLLRLDERLLRAEDGLRRGIEARLDFHEAQSLVGLGGGFLHLNDLVLFDADTNNQVPTEDAVKGRRLVVTRRALRRLSPRELLSAETLAKITGLDDLDESLGASSVLEQDQFSPVEGLDEVSALLPQKDVRQAAFVKLLDACGRRPALLGALLLFDFWRLHEDDRVSETGPFLVSAYLKGRNLTRAHLPAMASGLWRQSPRWQRHASPAERLKRAADALAEAARKAMAEMDRIMLARESLARKLPTPQVAGSETTLSALIDLFVAEPLVTVELAARRLKVTPQAVEYQFRKLGTALPREMTGRKRYRAWGL